MQKLNFIEKIGYASGSLGDSICYAFTGSFCLFFLTTVADIPPATAGIITAVGSVWNAAFNPVIGFCADRFRSSHGRRRPLIAGFSIPLALSVALLFTDLPLPDKYKPIYYGIILIMFWTCYTGYFVPYLALGVDYTSDYDDRTILRLYASAFNTFGSMICMLIPVNLVSFMSKQGISAAHAWSTVGILMGVTSTISILITVAASKKKDPPCESSHSKSIEKTHKNENAIKKIITEYISVAKLKPMRYLLVASTSSMITYVMVMAGMVYFFTYNMGLSAFLISICLTARSVVSLLIVPVVGSFSLKYDKKNSLICFFLIGAAGMTVLRFTDIEGLFSVTVFILMIVLCTSVYWQLVPSMYYDICEYDKIMTGKDREATIVSFQGLVEAVAAGMGNLILGITLKTGGFDGEAALQTHRALSAIFNATTVIPAVFLLISAAAIIKYPINKDVHTKIREKMEIKSNDYKIRKNV